MGMGSRGGGWDVFGCGHLVERISPGFLGEGGRGRYYFWGGGTVSRICYCCRSLSLWSMKGPLSP